MSRPCPHAMAGGAQGTRPNLRHLKEMAETEILEGSAIPARPSRRRRSHRGRILRITGLILIAAALVLAGYLWWNLWGTGFATKRAQDDLRPGFERNVASLTPADAPDRVVNVPGDPGSRRNGRRKTSAPASNATSRASPLPTPRTGWSTCRGTRWRSSGSRRSTSTTWWWRAPTPRR